MTILTLFVFKHYYYRSVIMIAIEINFTHELIGRMMR